MHSFIHFITDKIATRKGAWITLITWIALAIVLSVIAPSSKDHAVNNVSKLYPENSPSVIAEQKIDEYFPDDDGLPAIFVFETKEETLNIELIQNVTEKFSESDIPYVKSVIPLHQMPPVAIESFLSEDEEALFLPVLFEENITSTEINQGLDKMQPIIDEHDSFTTHVTGPAGIAVDATDLFARADLVLLFSTVGIILILLIITYRSPLLAFIPLLGAVFVYAVADRFLGLLGLNGVELASQSLSIMMILLFAVVIDYSLFIFSRFHEELKRTEDKYEAMQSAMREIGIPIFYSATTILLAMLVLFFADFGDYKNFAPIFSIAVFVVLFSALTLLPALFTIFGRRSFWPKIPHVGDETVKASSLWGKVGKFVTTKPRLSVIVIFIFLLISASNIFTMSYEYNTMKSFPDDMPSRVGYEVLEDKFSKGTLAATTVIFESDTAVAEDDQKKLADALADEKVVEHVRISNVTEDNQVVQYDLTFNEDPYNEKSMNALEYLMEQEGVIIADAEVKGELFFAGETAASVDNRNVNKRDIVVIVLAETLLIFLMLIFLTRSVKISSLMMGTILFSFLAALGIGTFLVSLLFGVDAISNRVPVYAFVFLVALGIDYNIFLVSRYLEEKKRLPVKDAIANAVANTGGVISSAGIILAATFAVLMTQPVEVLSTFGFIVAIGILMDTFLIRGVLLPGLLALLEKNERPQIIRKKEEK